MEKNKDLEKIIAKINLLMAKAAGSNSEEEAKTAARIADELISKYRINKAVVDNATQDQNAEEDKIIQFCLETRGRRSNWHEMLIRVLVDRYSSAFYMSFTYPEGRKVTNYMVVGKTSDIQLVEFLHSFLTQKIENLCKMHCLGRGLNYALSWCEGAVMGVRETLNLAKVQQQKEAETNKEMSQALAIFDGRKTEVENYLRENLRLGKAQGIGGSYRSDAIAHGREVGRNIKIRQGLKK
jgi:hypothetical protein